MKTKYPMVIVAFFALALFASPAAAQVGTQWDQQFTGANRFRVLGTFGNAAVLDKETGLVWERTPSAETTNQQAAHSVCNTTNVGGRLGWRLPTIQELASLVDKTQSNPALPSGHPFTNVQSTGACYLSATLSDPFWSVDFGNGNLAQGTCSGGLGVGYHWCVRGGQGVDIQ